MDELLPIDGHEHDHTSPQIRVNFNGMVTYFAVSFRRALCWYDSF
jgi:hypothetical protein